MRTAITVATQHDGGVVFLSDTTVPIDKQKAEIKAMKGLRKHAEFKLVQLWDSGAGVVNSVKFDAPKAATPTPPADESPAPAADAKRKK
jgi:hypothetical protein